MPVYFVLILDVTQTCFLTVTTWQYHVTSWGNPHIWVKGPNIGTSVPIFSSLSECSAIYLIEHLARTSNIQLASLPSGFMHGAPATSRIRRPLISVFIRRIWTLTKTSRREIRRIFFIVCLLIIAVSTSILARNIYLIMLS
jgi:hypothetical protein